VRSPDQTLLEAQRLLDAEMPFHAHEVLEDAWKSAPEASRALWKGLAQLAVGATHAARGNVVGAVTLLRRGADHIEPFQDERPYGIDIAGLLRWARDHATAFEAGADELPVPRLRGAG
jgi:predicted metal-dependent hydrolase